MPNWKKVITSGSDGILNSLNLTSTGSGQTVLDIQGSQGQLFSITDDLSGDIFAISDISGVPILNVNADGTTTIDGTLKLTTDETLDTTSDTSIKFLTRDSNGIVKYHSLGSNAFNSTAFTTNTGTTTASNTQTFTNKSGNISQWTNNSGYTTNTGTTTASNTQTFTNKSGNISQWTNNSGYTTNTGTLTPSGTINENEFAVWKTGTALKAYTAGEMRTALNVPNTTTVITNNTQIDNGRGFTTNTGTTTPSNSQTFTNKSGNISQWTNNSGYITSFTNTVDMGDGFIIEDGDGTEVRITENKEVKFKEGTGIDINWTDTSTGSDGDPYDLTITNTAPAGSTHLNSNTTKSDVGLSNVANESRATILGGDLTGKINGVAVADVTAGAAKGATSNQDSTSTIRSGTTKANVGLSNVANESRATILASAALTGTPTAPTQAANNNSTRIATTAYVQTEITDLIGGAQGT